VSYAYNTDGTLASKTDAKNQFTTYTYDFLKRVTDIKRYRWNGGRSTKDH
jgi:YD repeat-containing protein